VSVTVWIPNRNHGKTLEAAIVSAASQDPLEVVVIDDASEDDSVDIVNRVAAEFPCVRLIRWPSKTFDWQLAASMVFRSFRGEHCMVLSADDELAPGVVANVTWHRKAAVVFHDYLLRTTSGDTVGCISMGVPSPSWLTPDQFCRRLVEAENAVETGTGSSMRKEHLVWLSGMCWWEMGPWSDAIGYATIGALWGGVYCPGVGATFTINDSGYGATERSGPKRDEYHAAVRRFLTYANVPADAAAALMRKRQVQA